MVPVDNPTLAILTDISIVISCMSRALKTFMVGIPDMLGISVGISDAVARGTEAVAWSSGCIPSPGPAWRTASGRHWTLPRPLARTLSTHDGKAPVLRYRANMTSESSCVQSFSKIFVACRSASRRAAFSLSFRAMLSNGRWRDEAGRIRSGPRMASL